MNRFRLLKNEAQDNDVAKDKTEVIPVQGPVTGEIWENNDAKGFKLLIMNLPGTTEEFFVEMWNQEMNLGRHLLAKKVIEENFHRSK
jgi:hypothetical protein